MADLFNLLIKIGPIALSLGVTVSVALAILGFARRSADKAKWLGRYVLGLTMVGLVAMFVGAGSGIAVFCTSEKMGNLCGLGGVFGSGPLLAGIALAIYAYRRVLQTSDAP
ncbi:hypothetical protein AAV94_11715 [Lampropedia cohaerens]|uniref:Transmembrane protein n=1 Tax=Lampropedia cohaerens TaxID=1610491 RepID=A0A0U1PX99_9BURK|nr:hypothetical protein [Lampropedia cohaerens]KKW67183.1 hypothetical protein AAV94_11715 [Lampropedia cohaerens]